MFERYFGEGSEWIPRSELSTRTRMNLSYLEKWYGFAFDNQARKVGSGQTNSFLVFGTAPDGREAVYERTSGRTYIRIGGERHRLQEFGRPLPIYLERERIMESLPRIKRIRQEDAEASMAWGRDLNAFNKAKNEAIEKDIRDAGAEDLSEEELERLKTLLGKFYGVYVEPPPFDTVERGRHVYKYLTDEEKEEVKRLVREYRESYGV